MESPGTGEGAGAGVGVTDGDGDGVGVGVGVALGVGDGAGAPPDGSVKLATMPLAQAGVVSAWLAPYEPAALTTWALRIASLTVLLSCLFTRLKPPGAPQPCGVAPWLAPNPAKTISAGALGGPPLHAGRPAPAAG